MPFACRVLSLRDLGPALAPMNAFLIITAPNRFRSMQADADYALAVREVAGSAIPKVGWVNYAGLEDNVSYGPAAQDLLPERRGLDLHLRREGRYEPANRW